MSAFDNYDGWLKQQGGGQQGGGAFSNYPGAQTPTPPPTSTSAPISPSAPGGVGQGSSGGQDLGTTALWDKPAGTSWTDYLLAHMAGAVKPLAGIADPRQNVNEALAVGSGLTGGAQNLIPGVKDRTAQAFQELDPQTGLALSGAGYMLGPGKIGLASRIGEAAAPAIGRLAARGLGLTTEGALASGAGTAFQGGDASDIAKSAAIGGGLGLASGAIDPLARMISPGPKLNIPDVGQPQRTGGPATGMYAQKDQAYYPLDAIGFDNHGDAIDQAQAGIDAVRPHDPAIPKDVNDIVATLSKSPIVSGRTLQEASRDLRNTGDWTGNRFADALDNHLDTAQPMSINGVPTGQVGEAGAAKKAGDLIYGRIESLERLAQETPSGEPGPTPAAVAKTKSYYDQNPSGPEYQSLGALQQAMKPSFNWWVAHRAAAPLIGAAIGGTIGAFNPAEGQNRGITAIQDAFEGAAGVYGLRELAMPRPGQALNAARYSIATGQPAPSRAPPAAGQALRNLLFGWGSSGGF